MQVIKIKLWEKGTGINKEFEKFTIGDDYLLDKNLSYYDCIASLAHAKMLSKIGLLNGDELAALENGLNEIIGLDKQGKFEIKMEDEDCHTAIENFLITKCGDAGKKIHTGRSRNDQVIVALKLYMKSEMQKIRVSVANFEDILTRLCEKNIPIPGYTHMRKAMPSSITVWAEGYKEAMESDMILFDAAIKFIDSNPLGSAAGYGVNLDIDREYTAKLLGFSKVQSVANVQMSRGKNECVVINALLSVMLDLNKLASDLILFSMPEFGFFELPDEFCTGSSIMPHKKNPDSLELVRAKSKVVQSNLFEVLSIIQNLPSGYHRDFQLTKKPLMKSFDITGQCISIMAHLLEGLKINEENCKKAMTKELFAADEANLLVKKGMPFRDAYKLIGKKFQDLQ